MTQTHDEVRAILTSEHVEDGQATVEEDKWTILAQVQRELGPRQLVEDVCAKLGLEVAHVSPEKTGTVSNLEGGSVAAPLWISLQPERYFLRRSAAGRIADPDLLQRLGVADGQLCAVAWDHATQTLVVEEDKSAGGALPPVGNISLSLDMREGFRKMDSAISDALLVAFRTIVRERALSI